MSSNYVTVDMLGRDLMKYPGNLPVTVVHPGSCHWKGEGFVDGPNIVQMRMWEIRSGWDICEYQNEDERYGTDLLVLTDLSDEENLREWREPEPTWDFTVEKWWFVEGRGPIAGGVWNYVKLPDNGDEVWFVERESRVKRTIRAIETPAIHLDNWQGMKLGFLV